MLVGAAVTRFAACRDALAMAGRLERGSVRGKFEIEAVEHLLPGADGAANGISGGDAASDTIQGFPAGQLMSPQSAPVDHLTLKLLTPLRLHGASREAPTFHALMRSLLRRAAALASFDPAVGAQDEAETALRARQGVQARIGADLVRLGARLAQQGQWMARRSWIPRFRGRWRRSCRTCGWASGCTWKTSFGLKYRSVISRSRAWNIDHQA